MLFEDPAKIHEYAAWLSEWGFLLKAQSGAEFVPEAVNLTFAVHVHATRGVNYWLVPPVEVKTYRVWPVEAKLIEKSVFAYRRKEPIYLKEIVSKLMGAEAGEKETTGGEVFKESEEVYYLCFQAKTVSANRELFSSPYILVFEEVPQVPILSSFSGEIIKVAKHKKAKKKSAREDKTPYIKRSFEQIIQMDIAKVLSDMYSLTPERTVTYVGKDNIYMYICPFCGASTFFAWKDGSTWKFQCADCKKKGTVLHFIEFKENLNALEKKEKEKRLAKIVATYLAGKREEKESAEEKRKEPDGKEEKPEREVVHQVKAEASEEKAQFDRAVSFYKTMEKLFLREKIEGKEAQVSIIRSLFDILLATGELEKGRLLSVPLSSWIVQNNERFSLFKAVPSKINSLKGKVAARLEGERTIFASQILLTDKQGKYHSYKAGELVFLANLDKIEDVRGFPFAGLIFFPSSLVPSVKEFHLFSSIREALGFVAKKSSLLSLGKISVIVDPRQLSCGESFLAVRTREISGPQNIFSLLFFLRAKKNASGAYSLVFHGFSGELIKEVKETAELLSGDRFRLEVREEK